MAVYQGGAALDAVGHVMEDNCNHAQMSCKSAGSGVGMDLVVGLLDEDSVGKTEGIFVGALDGSGDGRWEGMKGLIGILDGDLLGKTLLDGKPEGPLDEDVDLDSPGDGCKEGMIEVVGEAVTRGESSTTVSKIATTLGRSRRKMVSL